MLFITIIICTSIYMGICAFFFFSQRSFIYFPRQQQNNTVDQIQVNTDQSVVRLSVSNPKSTRAILYFGGNAEDVSLSLPEYAQTISGVAIYMVHYRGYGGSTGSPSEAGLRHDALAIYRHLEDKHSDVLVMGRSLGTSLAIGVAAQFEPKGLLLITPFDSIQAIAQRVRHSYQYDYCSVIRTTQLIWYQTFNVQRLFWPLLMMKSFRKKTRCG